MQKNSWFVYIIQSEKGKLYTGITTDVQRRFLEHQSGKGGAKFFRSDSAKEVVYIEDCESRSHASIREAQIKKLSRKQKEKLVGLMPHEEG